MKVLWVCNIVLPDFSDEFGLRKYYIGGWMTSMLHQLESREGMDIAVCCPIIDAWRMKDGVCNGHRYYAFPFSRQKYCDPVKDRFREILTDYVPDVVHIWGTEFPHTLAMVNACEELGILDKTVIHIQGLVSIFAHHYYADVPNEYRMMIVEGYPTIKEDCDDFIFRGKYEIEALQKVKHVIGRTDWDEACTKRINPKVQYHLCNEMLRPTFYEHIGEWTYDNCKKHTIFVSQANYPIKGFHYLLKAMPEVLRYYPDAHIYVSGDNSMQLDQQGNVRPYGQYLSDLIKTHRLEGCITFLGMLNEQEMIERYKQANVFVSASSIENSSNSVQEAVLMGCPVIASYVGGTENYIQQEANGFLYQHDAEYMLGYYICKVFGKQEFTPCPEKIQGLAGGPKIAEDVQKIYDKILLKSLL